MARAAGIVYFTSSRRLLAKRRFRRLRERQAFGKDIMLIGSTGFRSFVNPEGELHNVLTHAREARIMLLNPFGEGAQMRAKAILDPGVTPEKLKDQIRESIEFLKTLRATQKTIRLKLYSDAPFLKLAILGDHLWLQHYHTGLDVQHMPECMSGTTKLLGVCTRFSTTTFFVGGMTRISPSTTWTRMSWSTGMCPATRSNGNHFTRRGLVRPCDSRAAPDNECPNEARPFAGRAIGTENSEAMARHPMRDGHSRFFRPPTLCFWNENARATSRSGGLWAAGGWGKRHPHLAEDGLGLVAVPELPRVAACRGSPARMDERQAGADEQAVLRRGLPLN